MTTIKEVSALTNRSPATIYRWIRLGKITRPGKLQVNGWEEWVLDEQQVEAAVRLAKTLTPGRKPMTERWAQAYANGGTGNGDPVGAER